MTPERLAKIRALASDPRGDPATRAIAQKVLDEHAKGTPPKPPPKPPPFPDQRHPGVKTSPEYDRYRYMDLNGWKQSANGNPTFSIMHSNRVYRIVLFRHKKTPTWGWLRINTDTDQTEFSGKFATISDAHADAWASLMEI